MRAKMKFIEINNSKINNILQKYVDALSEFSDEELKKFSKEYRCTTDPFANQNLHPASDEYLRGVIKNKDPLAYGFPKDSYGIQFGAGDLVPTSHDEKIKNTHNEILKINRKLIRLLGLERNVLSTFYPPGGYIGWHHNCNAPGLNLLLSYSSDGKGSFKHIDKHTGDIVVLPDQKGWTAKVGYYPAFSQLVKEGKTSTKDLLTKKLDGMDYESVEDRIEDLFWHAAYSENRRISVAFIVPNTEIWRGVQEFLESR